MNEVRSQADEDALAAREARRFAAEGPPGQKAVLYCGTIAQGTRLAKELGCGLYHSKAGSEAEKNRIVQGWRTRGGVIVATNALGLSLDVPDVRLVIHAGAPRALRDYCQESGRAGRDMEPCRAVVYCSRRTSSGRRQSDRGAAVGEYVGGLLCRREVIDKVIDDRVRDSGCREGVEEACDVCERVRAQAEEARQAYEEKAKAEMAITRRLQQIEDWTQSIVQQGAMDEMADRETLEHYVRQWAGPYCTGCQLQPRGTPAAHTRADECGLDTALAAENIDAVRTELFIKRRLQPYSRCFFCGFPQAMCGKWAIRGEGAYAKYVQSGNPCSYEGVLPDVLGWAWTVRYEEVLFLILEMGGQTDEMDALYRWLGTKVR